MEALVTGGAGFIGSHLASLLLARGNRVTVLDDLSTGRRVNIERLESNDRFEFVRGSAHDAAVTDPLVSRADVVFHLAAVVGVKRVVEDPVRAIESNVAATSCVLAAAARTRTRILLASTSEVYGKHSDLPFEESADIGFGPPTALRWAYACAKALDEWHALAYWQHRGTPATVIRLFNVAGPRQLGDYGMVLPRLVGQALRGEALTVYGDGTQTRTFIHVDDAIRALAACADHQEAVGQIFNIGSDHEVRIIDLAELIRARVGASGPIEFIPFETVYGDRFEDMMRRVPSLAKLKSVIGFEPSHDLASIIDDVIADMRRRQEFVASVSSESEVSVPFVSP